MSQTEIIKALVSGIPAAIVALLSAMIVLFVTQSRQDTRERKSDVRALRNARRERLRDSLILIMGLALSVTELTRDYGDTAKIQASGLDGLLSTIQKIEDEKARTKSQVTVDIDSEPIRSAFSKCMQTYERALAIYVEITKGDAIDPRVFDQQLRAIAENSHAAVNDLLSIAHAELDRLSKPE